MGIDFFLDKTVTVRRLTDVGGYKQSFTATASVSVHIQVASDEKTSLLQGVFGRLYLCWLRLDSPIDIMEGDKIKDADGRTFEVKTVNKRDFGINQHQEVIMERIDNLSDE